MCVCLSVCMCVLSVSGMKPSQPTTREERRDGKNPVQKETGQFFLLYSPRATGQGQRSSCVGLKGSSFLVPWKINQSAGVGVDTIPSSLLAQCRV